MKMGNWKAHRKCYLKWNQIAESSAFSLPRSPAWFGRSKLASPCCNRSWAGSILWLRLWEQRLFLLQTPKGAGQKVPPAWIRLLPYGPRLPGHSHHPFSSVSQPWYCCCYQLSKIALVPQKAARKQLIPISSKQQISFFIFWQFSFWRKKYVCVLGVSLNNKIGCQFSGLN